MDVEKAFKHIKDEERRNIHLEVKIRLVNPECSVQEVDAVVGLLMLRHQSMPTERIISPTNGLAGNNVTNMMPPKKHGTLIIKGDAQRAVIPNSNSNININNNAKNDAPTAASADKYKFQSTSKRSEKKRNPSIFRPYSLGTVCRDILKNYLETEKHNQKRD